jgi:hypothetical protein
MSLMENFMFDSPAEVFTTGGFKVKKMTYLRFPTGAEAIRHVIERSHPAGLRGTIVQVGEERFDGQEVRALYLSSAYPLPRQPASEPASSML